MNPPTLDDLLGNVAGDLPAELAEPARVDGLRRLARTLPAAPVVGFECRLADGDQVDLALFLPADDPGFGRVARSAPGEWGADDATSAHLRDLCAAVLDVDGPLHRRVTGVWLEVDDPAANGARRPPRVFVGTAPRTARDHRAGADLAGALVAAIGAEPLRPGVVRGLRRAVEQLPAGAVVAQVGLPLGIRVDAVRVCVSGIAADDVAGYLTRLGGTHDRVEVTRAARTLARLGEGLDLDLDVGAVLGPRIGLEVHVGQVRRPAPDRRWDPLLDWLVAEGACTPRARAGLGRWAGVTRVAATRGRTGPEAVAALVGDRATLCLLRGLHHVKLDHRADGPWHAKAYIGAARQWLPHPAAPSVTSRAATAPATSPVASATWRRALGSTPQRAGATPSGRADEATAAAVEYLASARRGPTWADFELGAGMSTTWVTAYVGHALASYGGPVASALARRAWTALAAGGTERGWGYHPRVPPDADSTAWALALAERLDVPPDAVVGAVRVLHAHRRPDGGLTTYAGADAVRAHLHLAPGTPVDGWTSSHPCVTAAAARLRHLGGRLDPYLVRVQEPDGSWRAYWWADREYATGLAVGALAPRAPADGAHRRAVDAGLRWLRARAVELLTDDGEGTDDAGDRSGFRLACCLEGLAAADGVTHDEVARAVLDRLVALQLADGSWAPSARLRVPGTAVADPDAVGTWSTHGRGTGSVRTDHGVFTTATVLRALAAVRDVRRPT